MNMARIVIRETCDNLGKRHLQYRVEGDTRLPFRVDMHTIAEQCKTNEFPKLITFIGFPAKLVSIEFMYPCAVYVRCDTPFTWAWYRARYLVGSAESWLRYRIVMTAQIWGIGWTPPNEEIRWCNLLRRRAKR